MVIEFIQRQTLVTSDSEALAVR